VSDFKGRHFGGEIVLWAVRWYCRYGISYRDLEQMMAERGVSVDHSTIYRWVQRYAPEIEKRLRWHWRRPRSGSWRVDETYVKVRGKWSYLLPSGRHAGQHDRLLSLTDAEHDGGEAFPCQGSQGAEGLGTA
jgi:transposase, IS6 family